jgi:hypothetical protein
MSKAYSKPNLRVLGNMADDEQLQVFRKMASDISWCMAAASDRGDLAQRSELAKMHRLCVDMIGQRLAGLVSGSAKNAHGSMSSAAHGVDAVRTLVSSL